MLINTGTSPIVSNSGLLTTLAYKIGDQPATYALEGSVAITGAWSNGSEITLESSAIPQRSKIWHAQ